MKRSIRDTLTYIFGVVWFVIIVTLIINTREQAFLPLYTILLLSVESLVYLHWLRQENLFRIHRKEKKRDVIAFIEKSILKGPHDLVLMYHGTLSHNFFSNVEVKASLNRSGKTRIIFGPHIFVQTLARLRDLIKSGKVELYQRKEENEIDKEWYRYADSETKKFEKLNHFIWVDGLSCWLEGVHPPGECYGGFEFFGVGSYAVIDKCLMKFEDSIKECKMIGRSKVLDSIGEKNLVKGYDVSRREYIGLDTPEIQNLREEFGEPLSSD